MTTDIGHPSFAAGPPSPTAAGRPGSIAGSRIVRRRPTRRRAAGLVAGLALGLAVLAGCDSEGVDTSCSLNSCTLTFDRGVTATANILGVEVKLVGAENGQVTLDVAGQRVALEAGQTQQAGAFDVTVQSVTADQVVVQVARAAES